MLYSEFLEGINQSENDYNLSEYERINALYMNSDTMTKAEAYQLYQEPSQLIKDLLEDKAVYKAEMIAARVKQRKEHEELLEAACELAKARGEIARMRAELNRYQEAAHNLYYATGTI